jgi:hypothetical protein
MLFEKILTLTSLLLCQDGGMGKGHQHSTLSVAYPKLAF